MLGMLGAGETVPVKSCRVHGPGARWAGGVAIRYLCAGFRFPWVFGTGTAVPRTEGGEQWTMIVRAENGPKLPPSLPAVGMR